jgi:hypothetical protein
MIDLLVAAIIAVKPGEYTVRVNGHTLRQHYFTVDAARLAIEQETATDPQACTTITPCYNGHEPSYNDPDCWPGAIWCPPAQSVTYGTRRHHK